ncbi:hypothetical protein QR680_016257 [Steinernema hermaphroditum]|uniref:dihydrofolate reductase n=1 Tax=Steinernema hermaphroditum TaxID=289476 RepID=A0AA39HAV4_9BILA|nr:hypothetical protein QR680_016257 [Steinernema hermaphroditum]
MVSSLQMNLIVAMDSKNGIGKGNDIPWRLRKDMAHFSMMTKKTSDENRVNVVIMGRKCWDSLPAKFRPLPGRINVVLSRTMTPQKSENLIVSRSLEEAVELLQSDQYRSRIETIWNIGGREIYALGLQSPLLHKLVITRVQGDFDAEVRFPDVEWKHFEKNDDFDGTEIEENGVKYHYESYTKRIQNTSTF